MTVDEAFAFFESDSISKSLKILRQVGIGHLRLDQAGNVLSGGEAQRLKLATSLIAKPKGKTLFLFDEPTQYCYELRQYLSANAFRLPSRDSGEGFLKLVQGHSMSNGSTPMCYR